MAGSALFRSAATTMARTPRRLLLQENLRRLLGPGPEPSNRLSSYSTSTNHRVSQTHDKNFSVEWDAAKAAAIETLPEVACFMALSTSMFLYFWVNPALDRMKDSLDAINIELDRKDRHERIDKENQIEARDLVGQGKETNGHQAS